MLQSKCSEETEAGRSWLSSGWDSGRVYRAVPIEESRHAGDRQWEGWWCAASASGGVSHHIVEQTYVTHPHCLMGTLLSLNCFRKLTEFYQEGWVV